MVQGLNFELGETVDILRESVRSFALREIDFFANQCRRLLRSEPDSGGQNAAA